MATYLGYPFDPELFLYQWQNEKDPTLTALFESGAVQANDAIRTLISSGSDYYTIPFYKVIGGDPENYDGNTDIAPGDPEGGSQSGIVYGRAKSWKDMDFIRDFNSGADPMRQITSQVAKYWNKQRQTIMLAELNGIYNIADDGEDYWDEWQNHTYSIATTTSSVSTSNKVGATTAADAIQKAVGDAFDQFSIAIMHSKVAANLAGLELLEYRKYTDANGVQRPLRMANFNGLTVIIDDGVPTAASASATGEKEYTTYLFGVGAFQYAPAPVEVPVEIARNPLGKGGYNYLVTRIRETLHPNGFSFVKPQSGYDTPSPTNNQLGANANNNANWTIAGNPKNIAIARIISNG
jgi:hypothetical protein